MEPPKTGSPDRLSKSAISTDTGSCAFGGVNPAAPPLYFLEPVGRSVYNGLQVKWTENVKQPMRGIRGLNLQVSYALSRFENSGGGANPGSSITAVRGDQDFIIPACECAGRFLFDPRLHVGWNAK